MAVRYVRIPLCDICQTEVPQAIPCFSTQVWCESCEKKIESGEMSEPLRTGIVSWTERYEGEIARYGAPHGAIQLSRKTAEKLAEGYKGTIIDQNTDLTTPFLRGTRLNPCIVDLSKKRFRIVDVRFDNDPGYPDGSRGSVVALCEPIGG